MSRVACIIESCYTHERVMTCRRHFRNHLQLMGHVTHKNQSWNMYEWVVSHVLMSHDMPETYGVATVSRIDKITGLFCRKMFLLQGSFAKETYNFIDSTNQSHPIPRTIYIESVMSHIRMSRGTCMSESCHTWMSHEIPQTWPEPSTLNHIMSHVWMSRVACMSESRYTYGWAMACQRRIRNRLQQTSHVTHINESRHICGWVMSHMKMIPDRPETYLGPLTVMSVTRLIHMCDMTHWKV